MASMATISPTQDLSVAGFSTTRAQFNVDYKAAHLSRAMLRELSGLMQTGAALCFMASPSEDAPISPSQPLYCASDMA